jgi:hypothetical protein
MNNIAQFNIKSETVRSRRKLGESHLAHDVKECVLFHIHL